MAKTPRTFLWALLTVAVVVVAYALVASAQPSSVKTREAPDEGEWVALNVGSKEYTNATNMEYIPGEVPRRVFYLYHTGTGKIRYHVVYNTHEIETYDSRY